MYNVQARCRVSGSSDEPDMWSPKCYFQFRTKGRQPDGPPTTDIGAFFIKSNSTVLYWKELESKERNEGSLHYRIHSKQTSVDYYTGDSFFEIYRPYSDQIVDEFYLYSVNDKGTSTNYSSIFIANENNRCQSPGDVRSISYDGGKRIQISWAMPEKPDTIVGYTVFWCREGGDAQTCNVSKYVHS